ncbi:MAG TPA: response regulator transcription factor [Bdellovibrionales bacterium]|nr:response regulator transcription factor [Bdellovibrionales bacterium]
MEDMRLLVVEDDKDLRDEISSCLTRDGYNVTSCGTAGEALNLAKGMAPALVLLDIGLPDRSGFDVCRSLRREPAMGAVPIVMLSGHNSEAEIVLGLETGADDYIVKPCTSSLLLARLRAVLRRRPKAEGEAAAERKLSVHGLEIDEKRHRVVLNGAELKLTPSEFKILHFLAMRPGWVFTRSQIVQAVKEQDFAISERSVDVQMFSLRKRLGELQTIIETVRGVGYRLKDV